MERLLIIALLLFSLNQTLVAQTVRIGPKVGLNIANYTGNVSTEVRSLAGL